MPFGPIQILTTTVIYSLLNLGFMYIYPMNTKIYKYYRIVHSAITCSGVLCSILFDSQRIYWWLLTETAGYHIYDLIMILGKHPMSLIDIIHHLLTISGVISFGIKYKTITTLFMLMETTTVMNKLVSYLYRNGKSSTWQFNALMAFGIGLYVIVRIISPLTIIFIWWNIDGLVVTFAGMFLFMNCHWLFGFLRLILWR